MKKLSSVSLLFTVITASALLNGAENIEPTLSISEMDLVSWVDSQEQEMLELLEQITNINSGTLNKEGVNQITQIFQSELRELGFSMSRLPGDLI